LAPAIIFAVTTEDQAGRETVVSRKIPKLNAEEARASI
jgi:hypothetical protein